jgi:hypothetical protein
LGLGEVFGLAQGAQVEGQLGGGLEEVVHEEAVYAFWGIFGGNAFPGINCEYAFYGIIGAVPLGLKAIAQTYVEFLPDGRLHSGVSR